MANDGEKGEKSDPKVVEVLKKILTTGIGAAFMTEEHIRSYLTDLKLPKDVIQLLLQGATKSKEELMNKVGNEVIKIVSKIDFVKEASRFVEEHKFRITAEIDVVKKGAVSVDIKKTEG
ncbi:MAG: hypothetical protein AABZ31_04000 [Bdellovibrionota bacterium]